LIQQQQQQQQQQEEQKEKYQQSVSYDGFIMGLDENNHLYSMQMTRFKSMHHSSITLFYDPVYKCHFVISSVQAQRTMISIPLQRTRLDELIQKKQPRVANLLGFNNPDILYELQMEAMQQLYQEMYRRMTSQQSLFLSPVIQWNHECVTCEYQPVIVQIISPSSSAAASSASLSTTTTTNSSVMQDESLKSLNHHEDEKEQKKMMYDTKLSSSQLNQYQQYLDLLSLSDKDRRRNTSGIINNNNHNNDSYNNRRYRYMIAYNSNNKDHEIAASAAADRHHAGRIDHESAQTSVVPHHDLYAVPATQVLAMKDH